MARHKKPASEVQVEPESGFSEMRTTQVAYPPYSQGCPKCHGSVAIWQRLFSRDVENIEISGLG
jgi:hypothetical protein